jgi:uncharacterized protein YcbK (DUF882 family)
MIVFKIKMTVSSILAILLWSAPGIAQQSDAPSQMVSGVAAQPESVRGNTQKKAQKNRAKKKKITKKRRRRRCQSGASPRYRQMVRNWRRPPKIPKPRYRDGLRDLTIYSVNLGERVRVFPYMPDGTINPEALDRIRHLFRDKHTHVEHEVHQRLIKVLYKLVDHFKARQINLISGFRDSKNEGHESNHGKGRAADIMIPGVKLAAVARRARMLGHVGVGFYPVAGFVHLDVRDRLSYFWADRSGPGKPGCLRRIMPQAGLRFDRKWRPKHDEPRLHRNRKGDLLGASPRPQKPPTDKLDNESRTQDAGSIASTDAGPDAGLDKKQTSP